MEVTMLASGDPQYLVNARVYHARGVDHAYTSRELTRVEVMALLKHQAAFAGRDVLDLGVGTGRTALYLAPLARRYEAIDYSPVMVEHVHATMPEISVRDADMRDLSVFADGSFDFVFATNNVLDAVGHDDRLRSLREAARVLRLGGMLMFSSHNRRYRDALRGPRLHWSRNPTTEVRLLGQWARQLANHSRVGKLRREYSDYALLNDAGHDYACLHYYIDQATERQQVAALGFQVLDVFDADGHSLAVDHAAEASASLMYAARKV
jgi:SAM-dependent methyltransferase